MSIQKILEEGAPEGEEGLTNNIREVGTWGGAGWTHMQLIIIQLFLVMKTLVVGEVAFQVGRHKVWEQPCAHEEWVLIRFGNNLVLMRSGFS